MSNHLEKGIFLSLIAVFIFACSTHPGWIKEEGTALQSINSLPSVHSVPNPRYVILPGDDIEIKFIYHPQFNERLEVLSDGRIFLPLVREVIASGKTPVELAEFLKNAYSRELKDPEVSVIIRHASGHYSYIGGEVKNPQSVPLTIPVSLLQAIIRCGDVMNTANQANVLILRTDPRNSPQVLVANLSLIRRGEAQDYPLEPYDIVYVPKTAIANVNEFIEMYINKIIPRSVAFPFTYEIHSDWKR